tara:strand:- start:334 stop:765 length:432 start_codon:yes stop_codon:yes gene_type:complete
MKRGDKDTISQWDKDNFNVACKKFFNEFVEFVVMHYALSHRDDTKYWKDISTRSFYDNRLLDDCMKETLLTKMKREKWLRSDSGHHCIATGLRYFGYDVNKNSINENVNLAISLREKEVNKWNIICKDKPKLIEFLKENIHHG